MPDVRKNVGCDYCGATYHIKFPDDLVPQYCSFCGEQFEEPEDEIDEEEDDGDLDYTDDERDLNRFN